LRFGIFYEHQLPRPWAPEAEHRLLAEALEQIELADGAGLDYAWAVEHHFLEEYSHSAAPEVFLAAASQRTRRIRLGHGIVQAPAAVNHPARIAERIATLDLVSGGRVEFGTGEASSAAELGGFGVSRDAKRAMWAETLDAVTRMFAEQPFAGYQGEFFTMPPRYVLPRPLQKPHPPLWVACSRRETIHLAARSGIGALSFSFVEPEDAAHWVTEYYDLVISGECVPRGFAVNPNVAVVLPMMLHHDETTAIDRGIDGAHFFGYSLGHYYGGGTHLVGGTDVWQAFGQNRAAQGLSRDLISATARPLTVRLLEAGLGSLRGAIGTPAQVTDLIARYQEAGVDQVIFVLQAGGNRHEHICESIELFAREVLPRFAEGREEREAAKADRLAAAVERALARRSPARTLPAPYQVDEDSEVAAARRTGYRPLRELSGQGPRSAAESLRERAVSGAQQLVARVPDGRLERLLRTSRAQRTVFQMIARHFDPAKSAGFDGVICYDLGMSDGTRRHWAIEVHDGRARAREGMAADAALTIRVPLADFVRMISDGSGFLPLLTDGRMTLAGDLGLANRMAEMFGGRSAYLCPDCSGRAPAPGSAHDARRGGSGGRRRDGRSAVPGAAAAGVACSASSAIRTAVSSCGSAPAT
jgi:alkanesulfonate monooxygenase SsuD/methylene tetrahydromethanopterin reductase-like flavin-dependent oxidoreductase (luciferase family)